MVKIIKADTAEESAFLEKLKARNTVTDGETVQKVKAIIDDVRQNGDAALNRYTAQFDKIPKVREVSKEEINAAYQNADKGFINALKNAADNIYDFHIRQKRQGFTVTEKEGVVLGYRIMPLNRVGLYVPGGTAAYPSSVLMNAIPAKIAGVKELIMITPPYKGGANPDILAAAYICGIDRIFLAGGAQGVAALAFGTETIPTADKIVGPGNIYVATAKKLLFGVVDIDMIAGPSEILIIADKGANPAFVAADMMSQAEHDRLSSSILLTDDASLAYKVNDEIEKQIQNLERKEIIESSLKNFGAIIVTKSIKDAVTLSNAIAPEHLEIMTEKPFDILSLVTNAGSVFLGYYSPEPLGDYYAGPNHVLPTSGTARFFSSLGVDSFIKKSGFTYYTREALEACKGDIVTIAEKEGLKAHANSISVRYKN